MLTAAGVARAGGLSTPHPSAMSVEDIELRLTPTTQSPQTPRQKRAIKEKEVENDHFTIFNNFVRQ